MRIAVLFHAHHTRDEVESDYVIGRLAALWRHDGHEVEFLIGLDRQWPADVIVVHVDLSVVPASYVRFARRYPSALNDRIIDIRKSAVSEHLVKPGAHYDGPVFVKTDLNSAGIPERKLIGRGRWRRLARRVLGRGDDQVECVKNYAIYSRPSEVPHDVTMRPGVIIEKFLPERVGDLYFTRRCFVLGDRAISHRMGYADPTGAGPVATFEWIDNDPRVLEARERFGLDYGVIDYTVNDGRVAVLDLNKTMGINRVQVEDERINYDRLIDYLAPGLYHYAHHATPVNVR